jgi:hypothetical protein
MVIEGVSDIVTEALFGKKTIPMASSGRVDVPMAPLIKEVFSD